MSGSYYLLKVLGLSGIPRIVTFAVGIVSIPLVVRALGAEQYGIYVYMQSAASLIEIFASGGVGSAAGKSMAACRIERPGCLSHELQKWVRLQALVAFSLLIPILGIGYLAIGYIGFAGISPVLFLMVGLSVYLSMATTFMRNVLQSLLAFRSLAGLDTFDSLSRNSVAILVALLFPSALGLVIAGVICALMADLVGIAIIVRDLQKTKHEPSIDAARVSPLAMRPMLRDSLSFLGLIAATRAYQALPNLLIQRMLGFHMVGIIGAFARIVEILALPFTVIGNAMMVRAQEVVASGMKAARRYWDMLWRFVIVAFAGTISFFFLTERVAKVLLPAEPQAEMLFNILTPLILLRIVSDLFAPASDYVGGLRARVFYLSACAVFQIPFIWLVVRYHGGVGTAVTLVVAQAAIVSGYLAIAHRSFFHGAHYALPRDVLVAAGVIVSAGVGALWVPQAARLPVFLAALSMFFAIIPVLRRQYLSGRFLLVDFI
ncbi:MAG: oligosaccharide flippase family protein [Alphaproteobacteria bacterium]|nr:oligosaccharide flippase family protein [Alphaproteobacteria bacterium]